MLLTPYLHLDPILVLTIQNLHRLNRLWYGFPTSYQNPIYIKGKCVGIGSSSHTRCTRRACAVREDAQAVFGHLEGRSGFVSICMLLQVLGWHYSRRPK